MQVMQEHFGLTEWLQQCKDAFPSDKMRKHIQDDGKTWDVYKLGKILQFHLSAVFGPRLGGDRLAYELLKDLTSALKARNSKAHLDPATALTEDEMMHTIRLLKDLLLLCKVTDCKEYTELGLILVFPLVVCAVFGSPFL